MEDKLPNFYNQDNSPRVGETFRFEDILFVLGECFGIAVYKRYFYLLVENDGYWFIMEDLYASIIWLEDIKNICQIANTYLRENGKPIYYKDTNVICGYEIV